MLEPQLIFAIVGGTLLGIIVRRLWTKHVSKRDDRLREIERQAIEESKRAEKREREAEGGTRSRKRSRQQGRVS